MAAPRSPDRVRASQTPGAFVLVVGPSGVGKDSLIGYARDRLAGASWISFPRRYVTRAPGDGSEDHLPISEADFQAGVATGRFAVHWRAHGLGYGLPAAIDEGLAGGQVVVCNVSRTTIAASRQKYPSILVVTVTAAPRVLTERLAGRGRESADEIEARLSRRVEPFADWGEAVEIDNSGPLEIAGAAFLRLLLELRMRAQEPAVRPG